MLQFFKDALLTLPIIALTPKWVSVPTAGQTKQTSVWLGDAYTSLVAQPVGSGDTTIFLTQVDEFTSTGTVTIDQEQITYTSVSQSPSPNISGCTRGANSTTATGHTVGTTVYPQVTYSNSSNIQVLIGGMIAGPNTLSLATATGAYGPPGVPLLLSFNSVSSGVANAVQINVQTVAPAGPEQQYDNLSLTTTLLVRPGDAGSSYANINVQPSAPIYVEQRDQGLAQRLRLLPITQQVTAQLPGFTWGQYRWRDNTTENAVAVVPTRWDTDTSLITQDFIGGVGSIGETNDLQPIDLEEQESSIFLRAQRGQYFTGVKRYYFPSDNFNLEFLPCYPGLPFTYTLLAPPKEQTPVFVGTWQLDSQQFYEYNLNARYTFGGPNGNFQPASTQPQFMVDRKTGILTVNAAVQQPQRTIILGVLSGGLNESFDIPYYPIFKIANLYVGNPTIAIPNFTFDQSNGNVSFPKVPGTSAGQPLFAVVDAAIAVLYEYEVNNPTEVQNTNIPDEEVLLEDTRLLVPDLNPAFSGLSSGYVYLQHRVLKPVAVTLASDKPEIPIPPTLTSIIGLIAYGPVYYNGDYSLLTATAIGSLPNENVPGAQLQVIPGGFNQATGQPLQNYPFRGLINGLDPNTNTIIVTTGGDGIANLVFQPEPDFGFYIPTISPWVTTSTTFTPTSVTWSLGVATLTFSTLSHKLALNTTVRLAGFTPSSWDGDYKILTTDQTAGTITIAVPVNPTGPSVIGTAGPADTLLLPNPIPISQLWSAPPTNEGWIEFLYAVLSNDPLFGLSNNPLTGNAQILSGTPNVGTIEVTNIPAQTFQAGTPITISNATSPGLDGSWVVATASLSAGVWTLTFNTTSSPFSSTAQSAGTVLTTGAIPFTTDGTVNGDTTITNSSWVGGVATFTLASAPTNLEIGQNIDITGCTTGTLNGFQNVLDVFEVTGTWFITTPTSTAGSGSESESVASFTYSNFRSNGVLSIWNKPIFPWQANFDYQVGDTIFDSNGKLQTVASITSTGESGATAPAWGTLFGSQTTDNDVTWTNYGVPGLSTCPPLHVYDKNGNDYSDNVFSLSGNAQIIAGTPNVATVRVLETPNSVTITPGDSITIIGATTPGLDGTWVVATANLTLGVWTITFNTLNSPFAATPQTEGILNDLSRGFNGEAVEIVWSTGLTNPSQGFVQAYLLQFLEREIIQMQVVGTNIYSNSIMLQMQAPNQLLSNPYLVLSTDQTLTPPYYPDASGSSRFNINRLGITTP